MNMKKKLNLLPEEIKNRYANKYLVYTASAMGAFILLFVLIQYTQIGILTWQTDKIIESNQKYDREKEGIVNLEESIAKYEAFMKDYENDCFPFSLFMYDMEAARPQDVYIISVDSSERLINEGVKEDENSDKSTDNTAQKKERDDKAQDGQNDDGKQEENQTDDKAAEPKIEYLEDLSGREIVIRGYGSMQESISDFIYSLTQLSYIGSAKITAIEEHKIQNGIYNIFEITVTGGAY